MIIKIPASDVYVSEHDWLSSKFLFSFAEYHDPLNMAWGKLRVWNDDAIAGENGFPMHSHQNFEIITIVFDGELTHEDSLGNKAVLRRGSVQHMSAGTGITHSEFNYAKGPVSLYQLWIAPQKLNVEPHYQERQLDFHKMGLQTLFQSKSHFEDAPHLALPINAEAKVVYGHLEDGAHEHIFLQKGEYVTVYVRAGHLACGHYDAFAGDQFRVFAEDSLFLHARGETEFVMVITS
jgi:quercetin 2,3-dioxygenase